MPTVISEDSRKKKRKKQQQQQQQQKTLAGTKLTACPNVHHFLLLQS